MLPRYTIQLQRILNNYNVLEHDLAVGCDESHHFYCFIKTIVTA